MCVDLPKGSFLRGALYPRSFDVFLVDVVVVVV